MGAAKSDQRIAAGRSTFSGNFAEAEAISDQGRYRSTFAIPLSSGTKLSMKRPSGSSRPPRAKNPSKNRSSKAAKNRLSHAPKLTAPNPSGFGTPPMPLRRVAFYVRVSTTGQTAENQLRDLRHVAERSDWQVVHCFSDTMSGTKGREARPGFSKLLQSVVRREVDLVAVWSLCRLSRSIRELLAVMDSLTRAGVDLFSHRQAIDTGSASGRMLFSLIGVFAEFERDLLAERVRAGLSRARAQGKRIGRPQVSSKVVDQISARLKAGHGIHRICKSLAVGSGTVQRVRRQLSAPAS